MDKRLESTLYQIAKIVRKAELEITECMTHGSVLFLRLVKPHDKEASVGVISMPLDVLELPELSRRRKVKRITEDTCLRAKNYLETGMHG